MMGLSGARRLVASSVQDLLPLPVFWDGRVPRREGRRARSRANGHRSTWNVRRSDSSRGSFGFRQFGSRLARFRGNRMASMVCRNGVAREGPFRRTGLFSAARRGLVASSRPGAPARTGRLDGTPSLAPRRYLRTDSRASARVSYGGRAGPERASRRTSWAVGPSSRAKPHGLWKGPCNLHATGHVCASGCGLRQTIPRRARDSGWERRRDPRIRTMRCSGQPPTIAFLRRASSGGCR